LSEADHEAEVRRWLRYALEDLASAEEMAERSLGVPRQACWLAQQAAEKAIKGALVFQSIDFPKSHDLDLLRRFVPDDWRLKRYPIDLAELSEWSVESRYPGDWPEATPADAKQGVALAQEVMRIVTEGLAQRGLNISPD